MKKKLVIAAAVVAALVVAAVYSLFVPVGGDGKFVLVDSDDNYDSVCHKISGVLGPARMAAFSAMSDAGGYKSHVRTGRYALSGLGTLRLFRNLRSGRQEAVRLTVPSVRTLDQLAAFLGQKLMADSAEWAAAFASPAECALVGCDTLTLASIIVPNTYEIYWNVTPRRFLSRMKSESDAFWRGERAAKARAMGLTPTEVVTLASIVDEETANNAEKPDIAGMYLNRLRSGMPLQADPTIKYAHRNFALRRIRHNLLSIDSPFNTYRNTGLPPGPIRLPSVAGIDAVLGYRHSDYLYMCAKEDFSGTHRFARTYAEHLRNAARYSAALNARGIN